MIPPPVWLRKTTEMYTMEDIFESANQKEEEFCETWFFWLDYAFSADYNADLNTWVHL